MNRERAETQLRLVAEAELRRATAAPPDGAAPVIGVPGDAHAVAVGQQTPRDMARPGQSSGLPKELLQML